MLARSGSNVTPSKKILDPPRLSDDQKLSSTSVPDRAAQRNVDHCMTCGLQTWSYINLPQQTFHGASDQLISSGKFSHYSFSTIQTLSSFDNILFIDKMTSCVTSVTCVVRSKRVVSVTVTTICKIENLLSAMMESYEIWRQ